MPAGNSKTKARNKRSYYDCSKCPRCALYDLLRFERQLHNDQTAPPLVKISFYED